MRIAAASHIEPLVRAFEKTKGDVLEMGTGYYSTILLSWLCELSGRRLYSFEASRKWFEKTVKNKKPFHDFLNRNHVISRRFDIFDLCLQQLNTT